MNPSWATLWTALCDIHIHEIPSISKFIYHFSPFSGFYIPINLNFCKMETLYFIRNLYKLQYFSCFHVGRCVDFRYCVETLPNKNYYFLFIYLGSLPHTYRLVSLSLFVLFEGNITIFPIYWNQRMTHKSHIS